MHLTYGKNNHLTSLFLAKHLRAKNENKYKNVSSNLRLQVSQIASKLKFLDSNKTLKKKSVEAATKWYNKICINFPKSSDTQIFRFSPPRATENLDNQPKIIIDVQKMLFSSEKSHSESVLNQLPSEECAISELKIFPVGPKCLGEHAAEKIRSNANGGAKKPTFFDHHSNNGTRQFRRRDD